MKVILLAILMVNLFIFPLSAAVAQGGEDATGQKTPKTTEQQDKTTPKSQEVDISEDNYRRFMELKDDRLKRTTLPLAAYKAPSDLKKIGALPESSQKHLRNQLREIILQDGQWVPADATHNHPYVPSEAAANNRQLQNLEAAAWDELLEKYNEREAENYARASAANSHSARGDADDEKTGSGRQRRGQAGAGQARSTTKRSDKANTKGAYSLSTANGPAADDAAVSTAGVSESALEFLLKNQRSTSSSRQTARATGQSSEVSNAPQVQAQAQPPTAQLTQAPSRNTAAASAQQARAASQQANAAATQPAEPATQQANTAATQPAQAASQQANAAATQPPQAASQLANTAATQPAQATSQSASASEAREQASSGSESSAAEAAEHAAEKAEKNAVKFQVQAKDTLSIKDLVNARGVSVSAATAANAEPPVRADDQDGDD